MRAATSRPETGAVRELVAELTEIQPQLARAQLRAGEWVQAARAQPRSRSFLESMLEQAPLNSGQGRALMSLAEALMRTPDTTRADQLVAERLAAIREAQQPKHGPWLIRSAFGLLGSAGHLLPEVRRQLEGETSIQSVIAPLVAPLARAALRRAMRAMGEVFIAGETIEAALAHGRKDPALARCSFDMLGEGARTEADAARYFSAYEHAIEALESQAAGALHDRSGISVKLSAIEARYSLLQRDRTSRST